jgi:beta-glucanase (GH16 family)
MVLRPHTQDSFGNSKNTKKTKIEGIENGFHTYGVDWTKIKWTFFVDVGLHFSTRGQRCKYWPLINHLFPVKFAIGGNFGGHEVDDSIFPQKFVDYVKVYQ